MLMYELTVYCSDCGTDLAETDSDDFDTLTEGMEGRAEYLYRKHVSEDQCR